MMGNGIVILSMVKVSMYLPIRMFIRGNGKMELDKDWAIIYGVRARIIKVCG